MKEHPIIMSAPMVKALLEDRKSMTRRLDKRLLKLRKGDRLWCKETWTSYATRTPDEQMDLDMKLGQFARGEITDIVEAALALPVGSGPQKAIYKADYGEWADSPDADFGHWRSSLFMPRWASRILLELTDDPYEERLQEITEEDAIAEGAPKVKEDHIPLFSHRMGFEILWGSLHTKPGTRWEDDPTVVVLKFRRIGESKDER